MLFVSMDGYICISILTALGAFVIKFVNDTATFNFSDVETITVRVNYVNNLTADG